MTVCVCECVALVGKSYSHFRFGFDSINLHFIYVTFFLLFILEWRLLEHSKIIEAPTKRYSMVNTRCLLIDLCVCVCVCNYCITRPQQTSERTKAISNK